MKVTRLGWRQFGREGRLVPGRAEKEVGEDQWVESAEDFLKCVQLFQTVLEHCLREERNVGRP